jgi:hypothetical protein
VLTASPVTATDANYPVWNRAIPVPVPVPVPTRTQKRPAGVRVRVTFAAGQAASRPWMVRPCRPQGVTRRWRVDPARGSSAQQQDEPASAAPERDHDRTEIACSVDEVHRRSGGAPGDPGKGQVSQSPPHGQADSDVRHDVLREGSDGRGSPIAGSITRTPDARSGAVLFPGSPRYAAGGASIVKVTDRRLTVATARGTRTAEQCPPGKRRPVRTGQKPSRRGAQHPIGCGRRPADGRPGDAGPPADGGGRRSPRPRRPAARSCADR